MKAHAQLDGSSSQRDRYQRQAPTAPMSTFLGSIRRCKMSTFTLSRCGEAAVAGLVHHETSKVARRVSCGRPEAWHASRFSAHIASAPIWDLDPEMGSATDPRP